MQLLGGLGRLGLLFALVGCASEQPAVVGRPGAARTGPAPGQCADGPLQPTRGLYVVTPLNQPVPESVLARPAIAGVAIRVSWSALQPTAQEPRFALIDEQLVMARRYGKRVSLSIEAGQDTPPWVYALGARPYSYVQDEQAGPAVCTTARLAIPWDPVYLDAFKQLIRAAGRRYNGSSVLAHVKVTGLGAVGQVAGLPHGSARVLQTGHGPCTTLDEVGAWSDVGYSRAKIVATWRELLEVYTQSFSHHQLAMVLDSQGFPPIDESGQLMRGRAYDTEMVPELLSSTLAGRSRLILVQSNELTNTSVYPFPVRLDDEVVIGYQMHGPVSGDPTYRMNGGSVESPISVFDGTVRRAVAARGKYLEVQLADAMNPQLTASFAGARLLLRQGAAGTAGSLVAPADPR